jgi:branched-chain amino acid transport system ATP-binding protein|tara:strand:+ start:273 stop:974 length:702 start_codon:yes stop_codon:yes gene_type:complete
MLLDVREIICGYENTIIVDGCNFSVKKGDIACIVGPNGAGKSTAMKAIFGLIPIKSGQVIFNNEDITSLNPQERVIKGMSFVPQNNNIFQEMSVEENLEMGAFIHQSSMKENLKNVYNLFPILNEKKSQVAGELSGGQRQQLAVGRALMTNPVLLMLDEPSAGVSPIVMKDLFTKLKAISKMGTSILVVEQNAKQALEISNLGFVLQNGKNKYSDTGKALLQNPEVRVSFLGG